MSEFFKGWRPKIGCMVLVVACVLMAGWIRSFSTTDWLRFGSKAHRRVVRFRSEEGLLSVFYRAEMTNDELATLSWNWPEWRSLAPRPSDRIASTALFFEYNAHVSDSGATTSRYLMLPYRSIVVPLMLLAAWLLLGPRSVGFSRRGEATVSR